MASKLPVKDRPNTLALEHERKLMSCKKILTGHDWDDSMATIKHMMQLSDNIMYTMTVYIS